jgi:probable HAF family extracellular repeat protein
MKQIPIFCLASLLVCACDDATQPSPSASADATSSALVGTAELISPIDLGTLGGPSSYAADVNNNAVVVGSSLTAAGARHAFRWTADRGMEDLGTLPGDECSAATSIAADGQILGLSGPAGCYPYNSKTVVWSPSGTIAAVPMAPLGDLPGPANDLNQEGEIVGWDYVGHQRAYYWSESSGKLDITGREGQASEINASGVVVGYVNVLSGPTRCPAFPPSPSCFRAFLWSLTAGYQELGVPGTNPNTKVIGYGLNNGGTAVGMVYGAGGAWRWNEASGFTLLPVLGPTPSPDAAAVSINSRETAVGYSRDVDGFRHAAAWPRAGGVVRLDSRPSSAGDINDWGAVVGAATVDGQSRATLWMVGPGRGEPGVTPPPAVDRSATSLELSVADPCLSDADLPLSRQALLECVTGFARYGPN